MQSYPCLVGPSFTETTQIRLHFSYTGLNINAVLNGFETKVDFWQNVTSNHIL